MFVQYYCRYKGTICKLGFFYNKYTSFVNYQIQKYVNSHQLNTKISKRRKVSFRTKPSKNNEFFLIHHTLGNKKVPFLIVLHYNKLAWQWIIQISVQFGSWYQLRTWVCIMLQMLVIFHLHLSHYVVRKLLDDISYIIHCIIVLDNFHMQSPDHMHNELFFSIHIQLLLICPNAFINFLTFQSFFKIYNNMYQNYIQFNSSISPPRKIYFWTSVIILT
eukprot:TRINITY_DN6951_c0_g1_i1.p2 TRINITY_DN6951_c0_g1~~TRINITY_DN6951_c0_g1_i1.p2  ORF type:complete len:218 (-),score=-25.72 TRINITY_DN6951_c0_g1_i1:303-956(-)